ncbi:MAG: cysteine desulfurase [Oscillospiraceae bacterium]|nr:cysteine desulfurase [Oscillospiraceae bacterium]MBQ2231215.1 cysteine desulfurase [Oscillospiraceae bacterium]MBQ2330541.1 cysteine desulfurase [Oscillospiraceae bacterium]MBQ3985673.1 cysteine desulfurase [Oscillospiraceae bacterium]MBQ5503572.1 cysteine desulfurase [Oscillospiraceae bacterium]
MIYADNAATTKMSDAAAETMLYVIRESYGNPSSLYAVGQRAKEIVEDARRDIASAIGAEPREIVFTSGGSEADNQAILSAAELGKRSGKTHVISSAFEHHAVLHTLKKLEKQGFEITLLDVHEDGIVRPEEVEAAIREDTCLVTIMYANNEIGTIQPIREIGAICRKHGVLFHTDAVQAVGHIPVNVVDDNIDLLSSSAHKFHGPKGVGFLYARKGVRLSNLIEGGAQERGKRAGTENVPGIAAMATALKEAEAKIIENSALISEKRDRLIRGLSEISHSALNGDKQKRLPGNVSFCFEGIEGESLLLLLDDRGICASSGSACTSGSLDPSHVLLAIGRVHDVAHGSLRLTIDETLSDDDVDYIVSSVKEVVGYLRGFSPIWRDLCAGKKQFIL